MCAFYDNNEFNAIGRRFKNDDSSEEKKSNDMNNGRLEIFSYTISFDDRDDSQSSDQDSDSQADEAEFDQNEYVSNSSESSINASRRSSSFDYNSSRHVVP